MNNGPALNGASSANAQDLDQLVQALNAIHDPRSDNKVRHDATVFLESAKAQPNAPSIGFDLASNRARSDLARHYGLSLLEHTIRYNWDALDRSDSQALRNSTVQLATSVTEQDPSFLRNKIAKVWMELAKKCWLDEWEDMDAQLFSLWDKSFAHQSVVLQVLELLSEDVFDNDDQNFSIKGAGELRRACIETFTSSAVIVGEYPDRNLEHSKLRYGDDGWFLRLLDRLRWCLTEASMQSRDVQSCTSAVLVTIRAMMPWMFLKALHNTACLDLLCRATQVDHLEIQLAAVEVMHSIFHRTQFGDDDVRALVFPMMGSAGIAHLHGLYNSTLVDINDLDDQKYLLSKKLTEVMCALGVFIELRPNVMVGNADLPAAFDLFVQVLRHQSLVVSIPIIYLWSRLLTCKYEPVATAVDRLIADLLEISSHRLLRYESLPSESDDPTLRFLYDDFDTMPDRHAFVGNYRRFCSETIEKVVRKSPFEAMRHILAQADGLFSSLPRTDQPIDHATYVSASLLALRVDAQCTVISSAVKGYLNWLAVQKSKGQRHENEHNGLQSDMDQWCSNLLTRDFSDPLVHKRILQLVSELIANVLKSNSRIGLTLCDHILSNATSRTADSTSWGEAVKELQASLPRMLQKLAMRQADMFLEMYSDIERGIHNIASSGVLEQRTSVEFRAVLLVITHRSKNLDAEQKTARLRPMIEPLLAAWQDEAMLKGADSFEGFCELIGLASFPRYFLAANAGKLEDWSSLKLDSEGIAMRDTISSRTESLPLQPLKCYLTVSTERLPPGSPNFAVAESVWEIAVPTVLPTLLKLLSHAHAFGNPGAWSSFPPEMQNIIQRTLVDRVWQAGISSETRDDFFVRVRESKSTLEGLASATRAAVRGIRELSYWILHCLCSFSGAFFKHQDLAEPLAQALYKDAHTLSSHQVSTLLRISMALLDACPAEFQPNFVPPLLINLFNQVDRKLTTEWDALSKRSEQGVNEDMLDQEMKTESVLRQLTYSSVSLVASLLNPTGPQLPLSKRALVLSTSSVLSTLIIFSTHALRMRDSRSCAHTIRSLRAVIPDFNPDLWPADPPAGTGTSAPRPDPQTAAELREFFGREVLQSAITSLHEPYFADLQKDLASLIAGIIVHYAHATDAPRAVLLSLPNMAAPNVDAAIAAIRAARSERAMRAEVLRLLEALRGVSIHEMGKVRDARRKSRPRTLMQERFMNVAMEEDAPLIRRGGSAEIEGVSELFG